ncbi:LAMI_0D06392g1_1 [Lachancea mirantina]|uniref:LAMI_0D06392g1_1 n=1 Tax=Lachancea mirantina TaxID=1230905 RepID=A0A1G4JBN6_9SACH|nr:LAMI_0D06392g1_1 [Lachancea mirantina]
MGLTEEQVLPLFQGNIIHLAKLCLKYIQQPAVEARKLFIIKKLMSNLTLLYVSARDRHMAENEISLWKNPLDSFVLALNQQLVSFEMASEGWRHIIGDSVPYSDLVGFVSSSVSANLLVLLFSEILVEDLTKMHAHKTGISHLHSVFHEHVYVSAMAVMNFNLQSLVESTSLDGSVEGQEIFRCVGAWISYTSMAANGPQGRMDLSETFDLLVKLMCWQQADTEFPYASVIIKIFGDVFANDPTMVNFDLRCHIEEIFLGASKGRMTTNNGHAWMLRYMNHLVVNEFYEELKDLALCVVDFLQVGTLDLCNKLFTIASDADMNALDQYIKVLLQMTNFSLVPVLQEFFSVRMVDFWLDLCDGYNNLVGEIIKPNGSELAASIFVQVVEIYLSKMGLLNKQKILHSDDDKTMIHEFDDFRNAILDLMESMWSVLGNDKLTDVLVASIGQLSPTSTADMFQVEAMCLALNKLMGDMTISECPWICDTLGSKDTFLHNVIFLVQMGCDQKTTQDVVVQTLSTDFVKTGTQLLGTIADFFCQDSKQLGTCIDALFRCLEGCSNMNECDTKVELLLIKCITTLCDTCRHQLKPYLPNFIEVQRLMVEGKSQVSDFTKQKFTRSLGYIIQCNATDGPEVQGQYVLQVFEAILQGINQAPENRDHVLPLLICLSELGTALITPEDFDDETYLAQLPKFREYWTTDPLQIRVKIKALLDFTFSRYSRDSELIEVDCLIFGKALELPDEDPHFLRYDMHEIMHFLMTRSSGCEPSTGLPYIIYLLEKVVNHYKASLTPQDFDFMLSKFFLERHFAIVMADPDLTQLMVNFVNSILDSKPAIALNSSHFSSFLVPEFLKLLPAKERFTIGAVTKFWTKLVNNKKFSRQDEITTRECIMSLGPQLTFTTISALFHTQRSDLNYYADVLRVLVARYGLQFRQWITQALPQICDNGPAHQLLIEKLFVTRGSRAAANAILEWWLSCHNLPQLSPGQ